MSLPTQKTPPRDSMSDLTVLLYGPSKIGKSTLVSNADHTLFLATEAGLNSLDVFQQPVLTWADMLNVCAEIGKGDHTFKTIALDTIDNAYKMCADHVCKKNNIQHESDLGFGKGFSLVNNEFQRVLTKLSLMPYGLWLISHAQDKEMDTPTGKRIKTIPTLPGKAREIVLGMVDIILFADIEMMPGPDGKKVERRVLRTKPSALYEAGDRTNRLPETIDLDFNTFVEAYRSGTPTKPTTAAPATATHATASPAGKVETRATKPGAQSAAQPAAQGAGTKPAPTLPEPPAEWVAAMTDLLEVTADMHETTRNKLVSTWEAEGPAALAELQKEIKTLRSVMAVHKAKTFGAVIAQLPPLEKTPIPENVHAFVDGIDPPPADGAISPEQYEALGKLLQAFGINRDAFRSYCFKAGHLLPGANGPTLARLKAEEFTKLRDKLTNRTIAAGKETWSQRTIRIINQTPITTFQPVPAAS